MSMKERPNYQVYEIGRGINPQPRYEDLELHVEEEPKPDLRPKNFPQVLYEANEVFKKLIRRKKV